jgi:hypothetical protein
MARAKDPVCLVVFLNRRFGADGTRIEVTVATPSGSKGEFDRKGYEFPYGAECLNGLYARELGIFTHLYFKGGLCSPEIEYDHLRFAKPRTVEHAAKTLRTVTKRIAKIREARGYAASWAEMIVRFAEAVGATSVCFDRDGLRTASEGHGVKFDPDCRIDREWSFMPTGEAAHTLRGIEAAFAPPKTETDREPEREEAAQ